MPLEMIIDLVLAVLLVAGIAGAAILHRRLQVIRKGQEEFGDLVRQLDSAVERAQAGVKDLRQAGAEIEERLRSEFGKGRALADELALITEAGDNLADRLEKRLTGTISSPETVDEDVASATPAPSAKKEKMLRALKEAR